ncbi:diketogulonate reductase-like aldo/keto reductase [Mesorhizobium sp. J18]|uniref:aldo/keto reductase n=1 Tax=Mesorhizobium sp. J18 TaxID=935263 RepID=UPI00119C44D9|nr:aldo/keto reductase [Mesorhizobium sp. J18]TWG95469.1 diketogulonate reductase-like aldo/keto reductase [Mesorhizobium sp. J18]
MHDVKANGASIPAIGLGTWTLKGDECVDLVEHALKNGYRHLDTAASYGNEVEVGEGLRGSGVDRDQVFVTTKVWWTDIAPGDFERSAEASLTRLGLDRLDLLLVHWPNPKVPLEGTIRSLNAMREQGITRHIGVSNFPTKLLAEAIRLSDAPLVANQVENHPYLDQSKVYEACRKADIAMVAYSPLYRGGELLEEQAIRTAAEQHGKTPGQIVLRWQVQQDGVVAIPRTSRKERLAENIGIFDFTLSEEEMSDISALRNANRRIANYDFSPEWDSA